MKVVVTADGAGLDAPASSVFGRCQAYVVVDTDAMEAETLENPAMNSASGAGIEAAQFVVDQGAEAVITGNVGPNAYSVLQAAEVPVFLLEEGTVRQVVEAFEQGRLSEAGGATGPAHAGLGRGRGRGPGAGRGVRLATGTGSARSSTGVQPADASSSSRQEEISELQRMAVDLRKQLAEVMDRLDQLEKEA
jgi:predicted Fe-Mo cluster-binding NifX family protein